MIDIDRTKTLKMIAVKYSQVCKQYAEWLKWEKKEQEKI